MDTDLDAGAQEDLYSREAKLQAAPERWEEAMNSIALTVASANSMNSLMEVQHQSPHPLPTGKRKFNCARGA